jgi:hypothetical protein
MGQARYGDKRGFLVHFTQLIRVESALLPPLLPRLRDAPGHFLRPCEAPGLTISASMSPGETIIQLLKIVIGIAFGAYFVWWSLEVLHRLPH